MAEENNQEEPKQSPLKLIILLEVLSYWDLMLECL